MPRRSAPRARPRAKSVRGPEGRRRAKLHARVPAPKPALIRLMPREEVRQLVTALGQGWLLPEAVRNQILLAAAEDATNRRLKPRDRARATLVLLRGEKLESDKALGTTAASELKIIIEDYTTHGCDPDAPAAPLEAPGPAVVPPPT